MLVVGVLVGTVVGIGVGVFAFDSRALVQNWNYQIQPWVPMWRNRHWMDLVVVDAVVVVVVEHELESDPMSVVLLLHLLQRRKETVPERQSHYWQEFEHVNGHSYYWMLEFCEWTMLQKFCTILLTFLLGIVVVVVVVVGNHYYSKGLVSMRRKRRNEGMGWPIYLYYYCHEWIVLEIEGRTWSYWKRYGVMESEEA